MNTTGKEGYWPIVQGLRPGLNDGEEPQCFEEGKTELGMAHYEVRKWSLARNAQLLKS